VSARPDGPGQVRKREVLHHRWDSSLRPGVHRPDVQPGFVIQNFAVAPIGSHLVLSLGRGYTPTDRHVLNMSLTERVMTDERRKSVALEYLKAFDNGGVTSTGESILELFAPDAQAYFPNWGIAHGKEEIDRLFGDVGGTLRAIRHEYAAFNRIFSGSDVLVAEGISYGEHRDGPWRAGAPD
jgi:hypothetical protein